MGDSKALWRLLQVASLENSSAWEPEFLAPGGSGWADRSKSEPCPWPHMTSTHSSHTHGNVPMAPREGVAELAAFGDQRASSVL